MKIAAPLKTFLVLFLFSGIVLTQFFYDAGRPSRPKVSFSIPPRVIKSIDLGLHSALASYFWIDNRLEVLGLSDNNKKFLDDFNLVAYLDPKLSAPYAFATLVIPSVRKYGDRIATAIEIGKRGIAEADPDWRIPYYVAITYHIDLKDVKNAAKYFDIAARTPGVPPITKRFSENYSSLNYPEQIKQLWATVYETAKDNETRERARAYLARIEMFGLLEKAARAYKTKTGAYPKTINDLVAAGIVREIPKDLFRYTFHFLENGRLQVDQ